MDAMNIEQLLTRVKTIMIDDGGCEVPATVSVGQLHTQKFPLLYGAAVQLSVTSALGLTVWRETVQPEGLDARKGQTEHGNSAVNNSVFNTIKLGAFHQSTRETPMERRCQRQPSSQASEKPARLSWALSRLDP